MSLFCSVPKEAVIEEIDVENSIYELPHMLRKEGLDELVTRTLGLDAPAPKLDEWEEVVQRLQNPKHHICIGMVGKRNLSRPGFAQKLEKQDIIARRAVRNGVESANFFKQCFAITEVLT